MKNVHRNRRQFLHSAATTAAGAALATTYGYAAESNSMPNSIRLGAPVFVHLDPCNAINSPARFYNNRALINECFDKLGPWIVSCHAKDVAWEVGMQVHFREVVLGTGKLDYSTYLKRLVALPQNPPLMIEHLKTKREYHQSRDYLLATGATVGISFH